MYDPPAYLWAITIAGPTGIAAATCIVLYGGAERAGLGRRRAALLAGAAAVVLGGWFTATALIAGHGWYHTLPWFPVAAAGFLGTLLALSRIPVVALSCPAFSGQGICGYFTLLPARSGTRPRPLRPRLACCTPGGSLR